MRELRGETEAEEDRTMDGARDRTMGLLVFRKENKKEQALLVFRTDEGTAEEDLLLFHFDEAETEEDCGLPLSGQSMQ